MTALAIVLLAAGTYAFRVCGPVLHRRIQLSPRVRQMLSVVATFLYFEQAAVVAAASDDPAGRTRIFASVDLAVGVLTLAVQFLATGKLIQRFGVGPALALVPVVFVGGFAVLAAMPVLAVVITFQALQRTANFLGTLEASGEISVAKLMLASSQIQSLS